MSFSLILPTCIDCDGDPNGEHTQHVSNPYSLQVSHHRIILGPKDFCRVFSSALPAESHVNTAAQPLSQRDLKLSVQGVLDVLGKSFELCNWRNGGSQLALLNITNNADTVLCAALILTRVGQKTVNTKPPMSPKPHKP